MKLWQTNTFAATALVLAVYGCSSGDDDTAATSGTGGKAGHAGAASTTGGKTSTGGKSSTGGKAAAGHSTGGMSTGGTTGGAVGSSGQGGESASGGVPGAGGASGGASGGEGNLGGEGGAAAVDVSGKWDISEVIAAGPSAGTYTGVFTLVEAGDGVTGSALWTGGTTSALTGYVHGSKIHLDRLDGTGFHATFDGRVNAAADAITGTGKNDAASPGGNNATYTWTGTMQ